MILLPISLRSSSDTLRITMSGGRQRAESRYSRRRSRERSSSRLPAARKGEPESLVARRSRRIGSDTLAGECSAQARRRPAGRSDSRAPGTSPAGDAPGGRRTPPSRGEEEAGPLERREPEHVVSTVGANLEACAEGGAGSRSGRRARQVEYDVYFLLEEEGLRQVVVQEGEHSPVLRAKLDDFQANLRSPLEASVARLGLRDERDSPSLRLSRRKRYLGEPSLCSKLRVRGRCMSWTGLPGRTEHRFHPATKADGRG